MAEATFQITDFLGNQTIAEAELRPPHLNHDAFSQASAQQDRDAANRG